MARRGWKIRMGRRAGKPEREAGPVGRFLGSVLATAFFGLFFGLGVFFTWALLQQAGEHLETYRWTERVCEVERSEVVRAGGEEPYEPRIAFRSIDAGPALRGQRIQLRDVEYGSHGEALARLAPYPVGAVAPCYASEAGELVLERGPFWSALLVFFPLIFVAIGGVGLWAVWSPDRPARDAAGRPRLQALGANFRRRAEGRVLLWMGALFAAIGGLTFWFFGALPLWQVYEARGWDAQRCTVEHSSVVAHQSDDGTTYSVDIFYRWDRGRGVERSSRYSFFGGSSSGRAAKAEIVAAHPKGAEVACWVHPRTPNEAVLERELTLHAAIALVPLAFLVIGLGMLLHGRHISRRRAAMRSRAYQGGLPFRAEDPVLEVLPTFEMRAGPVPLAADSPRWLRFVGLVFATLFWNGIVSVFAYQSWKSWQRGDPEIFLMFFLVPFVLVGIALVFGVIHALLAMANPHPVLSANASTVAPGRSLELQWRFRGRTERLSRVRLSLVGREEATYRVGTNTRTAQETFH
ncbi:MAG: DUF3592 domain-containing protein, partial [Myxococcota bacterium]